MSKRISGNILGELALLLVTVAVLAAVAKPMYNNYAVELASTSARGDLKMLYSAVEAYFTEHRLIPDNPENAVPEWIVDYSGKYKYSKTSFNEYRFLTKNKINGEYLFIDQDGTINELQ